jgi:superfamily II DNA or RNA helicase
MVCGIGFLSRIREQLEALGYDVDVKDINPVHPRPDRYHEDWDNVLRHITFKPRQEEMLVRLAGNGRGIVDAPTGFGKSFLYKAIGLLYPNARILVTTKRKDLVQATRLDLSTVLPNIGQIGGGVFKPGRITICTADSLHKADADNADILIGEEAHELAAESYAKELARFKYARMYGFSATPGGRMDNADIRLESLFGPVIFKMTYQEAVDLGLVVPIRVRWLDIIGENPCQGMVDTPKRRWGLWRHKNRNQLIADTAMEFGDSEQVLIMVTTFEHAVYLRQHLPEFTLCYAERDDADYDHYAKKGLLPADEPRMTTKRRQELRLAFASGSLKKVIATDVWSTGVSFNGLSVLIRADARSSEIMDTQIPGRVCRVNSLTNKAEGLIIDCLDQFDPGFRDAARKRRRHYESKGWTQDNPRVGRSDLAPRS